jgi:hypothetical protein
MERKTKSIHAHFSAKSNLESRRLKKYIGAGKQVSRTKLICCKLNLNVSYIYGRPRKNPVK